MPRLPKRPAERRRRNDVEGETTLVVQRKLEIPTLPKRTHKKARDWFEAVAKSGQAEYFEPSDWETAVIVTHAISEFYRRPTASLLNAIRTMTAELLTTENARRRVHMFIERPSTAAPDEAEAEGLAVLEEYREMLAGRQ